MATSLNPTDMILWGGLILGAVAILKPSIINDLVGRELIPINDTTPAVVTDDTDEEDDGRTPNTVADTSLHKSLKAINFYGGKIAGMVTVMAKDNIFSATQIKEYILDKHISEVEHIAQLVEYDTESIDYTNVIALREIAQLAIDVSKELHIEYRIEDTVSLEVIAGLGRGIGNLPPSQNQGLVVENVLKFLANRFNGAPEVKFTGEDVKKSSFTKGVSSVRVSGNRVMNVYNIRRLY